MSTTVGYDIRAYEDRDEDAVLDLLNASLGGGPAGQRPASFFRWKHLENPFGRSYMIVADAGGDLIGLRAFMRWEFKTNGAVRKAVRAVDTATHPDWQGKGIFSRLTMAAIEDLASQADFIFNTPNDKSLPGYLKMGWQPVARIPVWVRVTSPWRLVRRLLPGRSSPVATSLARGGVHDGAIPDIVPQDDHRLRTNRSAPYLRWRYNPASLLDYRIVTTDDGIGIVRVRARGPVLEARIADLLATDPGSCVHLLRTIKRQAGADVMTVHAQTGTPLHRAIRRAGFIRARGPVFVTRTLGHDVDPDPRAFANWALSAGDLEVF